MQQNCVGRNLAAEYTGALGTVLAQHNGFPIGENLQRGVGRDAVGVALSNIIQSGADMDDEIATAQDTVEFNMGG